MIRDVTFLSDINFTTPVTCLNAETGEMWKKKCAYTLLKQLQHIRTTTDDDDICSLKGSRERTGCKIDNKPC